MSASESHRGQRRASFRRSDHRCELRSADQHPGFERSTGKDASAVILLRGHGAAVVASSLPNSVFRAYYTEVNAREQEQAIALGGKDVVYIAPEEAEAREKEAHHKALPDPWELWKREDWIRGVNPVRVVDVPAAPDGGQCPFGLSRTMCERTADL
jgi:hypothetical protein